MHDPSRRLVQHDQSFILVDDLQIHRLRSKRRQLRGLLQFDFDQVSLVDPVTRATAAGVDPRPTAFDPGLDAAA